MEVKAVTVTVENGLAIITMDDTVNPVNTWTDDITVGFVCAIDEVNELADKGVIQGVIITSGKPGTFHTGANLNKMGSRPDTVLDKMKNIEFNHSVLNRIEKIRVHTLAVINGHCMGGGLELALACGARIAANTKNTKIGLPEFNVGLFPAGGGTQRLPRLIGPKGIDFIVNAKVMSASEALDAGIIDRCVGESDDLLLEGKKFLREIIGGSVEVVRQYYDFSGVSKVVADEKEKLLKKTKGRLLPAPKAFFEVIENGLAGTLEEGLELEKKHFVPVSLSPECKGYIHSFFLKGMTDKPQKMMTKGFEPRELKKTAVLGFGNMGRGIVICILKDMGAPVVVKDTPEALEAGKAFVFKMLTGMYDKKRLKTPPEELMKLIIPTTEFDDNFKDVDIVVEAIFEDIGVKETCYTELCSVVPDDCLIASNTSGLSVTELAKFVTNPDRFGGLHFFSPVWLMALVEIVRGEMTSQATIDNLLNFSGLIRKRPLICKDSPSFVVNAVLRPFTSSGLKYMEEGSGVGEINEAFTQFGLPVGPVKLADEIGLDVMHHIFTNRGEEQKTLEAFFNDGRYGTKKCGKGIFLADGSVDPEALELVFKRDPVNRTALEMTNDLLTEQIKIAKDLLDRGVVDSPHMVDIGMLYGTGYPQDKGGPLKWADLTGLSEQVLGEKFYG